MSQSQMPSYPDRPPVLNTLNSDVDCSIQSGGYYSQHGGSVSNAPFAYQAQPSSIPPPPPPPISFGSSSFQHGPRTGIVPVHCGRSLSTTTPYRKLLINQNVEVLIGARGWVVGIIIGVLKAVDAVTNWGYKVEYMSGNEAHRKDFSASHVRPLD